MPSIVWTIAIGAVAGWFVGQYRQGIGFSLVGSIVVGVIGAAIGNSIFRAIGWEGWFVALDPLIAAIFGAFLFLYAVDVLKRLFS